MRAELVKEVVVENSRAFGDKPAVIYGNSVVSYRELDLRSNRVANGLRGAGEAQSRVAVLDRNRPSFFEIWFGAAKVNMVTVALNFRLASREIGQLLNDCEAHTLFVGSEFLPVLLSVEHELPRLKNIIVTDRNYPAWRDAQDAQLVPVPVSPEDVGVQLYTSGTTGLPKGVQLTNSNLSRAVEAHMQSWGNWTAADTVLLALPVFHIAGGGGSLVALTAGATIVMMDDFKPAIAMDLLQQHDVTITVMVPTMIQAITQNIAITPLPHLRTMVYGGAPMHAAALESALKFFPNTQFRQIYGLTETTGSFAVLGPEDHDPSNPRLASCGRVCAGMGLLIVDGGGQPVSTGSIGEVACQSPGLMIGYWRRDDATREAIRDGWFYTGDLGYLDEDGYLYLIDRKNDMIVSGGENVYPAEVEAVLGGHPAVADVAVVGIPDERWGEAIKALVVLMPGTEPQTEAIFAYARSRIAGYKLPKSIDYVAEIPRNASGKILRRQLSDPFWAGGARRIS